MQDWPPADWTLDQNFDLDYALQMASSGVAVDPFSPLANLFLPLSSFQPPFDYLDVPPPTELQSPGVAFPLPPLNPARQALPIATYGITDTLPSSRKRARIDNNTSGFEHALDVGEDGAEPLAIPDESSQIDQFDLLVERLAEAVGPDFFVLSSRLFRRTSFIRAPFKTKVDSLSALLRPHWHEKTLDVFRELPGETLDLGPSSPSQDLKPLVDIVTTPGNFSNLTTLAISHFAITSESLLRLHNLPALSHLSLLKTSSNRESVLSLFPLASRLSVLRLVDNPEIKDSELSPLSLFPALSLLDLTGTGTTGPGITLFVRHVAGLQPNLKHLWPPLAVLQWIESLEPVVVDLPAASALLPSEVDELGRLECMENLRYHLPVEKLSASWDLPTRRSKLKTVLQSRLDQIALADLVATPPSASRRTQSATSYREPSASPSPSPVAQEWSNELFPSIAKKEVKFKERDLHCEWLGCKKKYSKQASFDKHQLSHMNIAAV